MSELRVDSVKSKGGGAPNLPKGVTISGIATAATLGATTIDVSNVNVSGVVTSATLNGELLSTGTPTLGLGVTINSSGLVISGVATAGIVSATTLYGDASNLSGIGATVAPLFYNPDISDRTVTVGTGIGITFNSQIKAGSGNINLRLVSIGGTIVEAFGVGSSVTISENRLSFDPASDLDQNTIYCVDIPGTALTNNDGTAYVGTAFTFQSSYTFNTLYGWGNNEYGGLGQNNRIEYSSPVQIPGNSWEISNWSMGVGSDSVFAIKNNTLWAWGDNQKGQLGQGNDNVHQSSPVQIPGTTWSSCFNAGYTAGGVKSDGTMWGLGYNDDGELGVNDRTQYSSPKQVPGTTWSTGDRKNSAQIGMRGSVKTDGTLWVWGQSWKGGLGTNCDDCKRSSPIQIPGTTWNTVAIGNHSLATKTDGTLWAMGDNSSGTLGQNHTNDRSSPVQIPGTDWSGEIEVNASVSFAIKTDGTFWAWGYNANGQLGLNDTASKSSPIQIPGTTWSKVAATQGVSGPNTWAIKTDGTLWGMGWNSKGQLGQNSLARISSPIQIGSDTTWTNVKGCDFSCIATKSEVG